MNKFYKFTCTLTSILFAYLFIQLFFLSDGFVKGLGLEPSLSTLVLSRRVSMFMIGIPVLMITAWNLSSINRWIICTSTAVTLFGLSCIGSYEYIEGHVNSSIFVAIISETVLWISFAIIVIKERLIDRIKNKKVA
jgi:hypothetical protein